MNNFGLSPLINDGLVIQRDASFPVRSSKKIKVAFLNKIYESVEENGKWLINLEPVKTGGPFVMEIKCEDSTKIIKDIYAGDVWLCSGQSNMEMEMRELRKAYPEEWENLASPIAVKHFKVPKESDFFAPNDDVSGGGWTSLSKETLNEFSAAAWFFAKNLHIKHGVPIGLINATWGGTPVEAWMSAEALKDYPAAVEEAEQYRIAEKREEAFKKSGYVIEEREYFFAQRPIGNFNKMINPVLKFPLKGVIWYQGESNEGRPFEYSDLFRKMIVDWRKRSGQSVLPFLFVQLPVWKEETDNCENSSWALIREAQMSALELPATGMACALELGQPDDIHPLNKKDVGYRLFLAADKLLFGGVNSSPGPVVRKMTNAKSKINLYFDNCAEGLDIKGTNPYVSIIGDGGYTRLPAEIIGKDCVSIDVSSVKNPRTILYAWADNPKDRQLFNKEGLPVIPFKIKIDKGEKNV